MLTTYSSNGTRASERGYYAFGSERRADGPHLATDYRFTGQKADGTGLYYYNARYYDPVIGQFISPDTIVPDPNRVYGYNRYMYTMGNPLNLVDPSGHYPDDVLMKHFGCDDWACVESQFGAGGQHEGRWGWLDVLKTAQDGDPIRASYVDNAGYLQAFSGSFATVDGKIMLQGQSTMHTGVSGSSMTLLDGLLSEQVGAAYGSIGIIGWYDLGGSHSFSTVYDQGRIDCRHQYCVALVLDGLSVTASTVAVGCAMAGQPECVAPAAAAGRFLGIVSVGYTALSVYRQNATTADVVVTTTTAVIGDFGPPVAGLYTGVVQSLYDYSGAQRGPQ